MKMFIWKLRFTFHMMKRSNMNFVFCWHCANAAIENNPDYMWEDGPIEYAEEEMASWSD